MCKKDKTAAFKTCSFRSGLTGIQRVDSLPLKSSSQLREPSPEHGQHLFPLLPHPTDTYYLGVWLAWEHQRPHRKELVNYIGSVH